MYASTIWQNMYPVYLYFLITTLLITYDDNLINIFLKTWWILTWFFYEKYGANLGSDLPNYYRNLYVENFENNSWYYGKILYISNATP